MIPGLRSLWGMNGTRSGRIGTLIGLPIRRKSVGYALLGVLLFLGGVSWSWSQLAAADDEEQSANADVIRALERFQTLIGEWRGVGQPKRAANDGAWKETAAASWHHKADSRGIHWVLESSPLAKGVVLGLDPAGERFVVTVDLGKDRQRVYRSGLIEKLDSAKPIVFESAADDAQLVHRLTLTVLSADRVTWLWEQRPEKQSFFTRVAEVGCQRQGTKLATSDGDGPECVVTGGKGTIPVSYQGKTYYVCCTGCRDAFNDDPEKTLADYAKRVAEKKAKK